MRYIQVYFLLHINSIFVIFGRSRRSRMVHYKNILRIRPETGCQVKRQPVEKCMLHNNRHTHRVCTLTFPLTQHITRLLVIVSIFQPPPTGWMNTTIVLYRSQITNGFIYIKKKTKIFIYSKILEGKKPSWKLIAKDDNVGRAQ